MDLGIGSPFEVVCPVRQCDKGSGLAVLALLYFVVQSLRQRQRVISYNSRFTYARKGNGVAVVHCRHEVLAHRKNAARLRVVLAGRHEMAIQVLIFPLGAHFAGEQRARHRFVVDLLHV